MFGLIQQSFQDFKVGKSVYDTVEADCKYNFYLGSQVNEMERLRRSSEMKIPVRFFALVMVASHAGYLRRRMWSLARRLFRPCRVKKWNCECCFG
jgi:hypothetical protein